jgi:MFS family permease
MNLPQQTEGTDSHKVALTFILLLGIVSLFADMTYEGARSITGPYLAVLGASGAVVGAVAGFGELVGYGLRLFSGYLSDRTRRYWAITIIGYGLNLLAVPLLALAGNWQMAALLLIAERTGKAIRTPARDAMLSHAAGEVGRGWGFGLHEALDQVGAVLGPLIVAAVLFLRRGSYQAAFVVLLLPALLALGVLLIARSRYPRPRELEPPGASLLRLETGGFAPLFWLYLLAGALLAAGFADFPLIAFHFERAAVVSETWVPLFYALAMGVDALAALFLGWLFDRVGLLVLVVSTLLSALFAPLVFTGGFYMALAGMALWGLGMAGQESVLRAVVADLSPSDRRGTAFGLFNGGYGMAWFLGSALMGLLYDRSIVILVTFAVVVQVTAALVFVLVLRSRRRL